MKKLRTALIALILFFAIPLMSRAGQDTIDVYVNGHSNVRSLDGEIVTSLKEGVKINGYFEGSWFYFNHLDQEVKIYAPLVSKYKYIVNSYANIRADKAASSELLGSVKPTDVLYGNDLGGWTEVAFESHRPAYIWQDFIQTDLEEYWGFTAGIVNVRSLSGEKLGSLAAGTEIKGYVVDSWLCFEYEGAMAKVYRPFIQDESPISNRYYIIGGSNIRATSEADSEIIGSLRMGYAVKAYPSNAKLYRLEDGGYVHKSLLSTELVGTQEAGYMPVGRNVRNYPDTDTSEVVEVFNKGRYISGYRIGNWIRIYYNDQFLYIASPELSKTRIKVEGFTNTGMSARNKPASSDYDRVRYLPLGSYLSGELVSYGNFVKFSNYGSTVYLPTSALTEMKESDRAWVKKGNLTYYIDSNANVLRGWQEIDGSTYFFEPMMRYMFTGVKATGKSIYYFTSSGKLSTGSKTIYGTKDKQTIRFYSPTAAEKANDWSTYTESDFLRTRALNESLTAIGTKYYWYGVDLKNGVYCSGLAYAAYKEAGVIIPGPEYGNEAAARTKGAQTGPLYRGYGPAGNYGYQMVVAQYNQTDDYTGGSRFNWNYNFNNLKQGYLIFARNPAMTKLDATHTTIYAGKINGVPYIMHSGYAGTYLEPASMITNLWGYNWRPYAQRPLGK